MGLLCGGLIIRLGKVNPCRLGWTGPKNTHKKSIVVLSLLEVILEVSCVVYGHKW